MAASNLPRGALQQAQLETDKASLNFEASMRAKRAQEMAEYEARAARLSGARALDAEGLARLREHESELARASFQRYGKWTTDNFEPLKVLGHGGFGTVTLVRHRKTRELFALKQMDKERFQDKNRQRAYWERDALGEARSRWSVELHATFQDSKHVYMVMEFVQGGDLVAHICRKQHFSMQETSFYMAELLEAIDTVHKCGLVHRDIKPDNLVITRSGHLKLLDFGLCRASCGAAVDGYPVPRAQPGAAPSGRTRSVVGTPQYMAPESFSGVFGPGSDLWAIGVIAYECLVGVVPFHAGQREGKEALEMIKEKILHHYEVLPRLLAKAREKGYTSAVFDDFLYGTLASKDRRFTAEAMRAHPFFAGLRFSELHLLQAPIVPEVSGPEDTSYFEDFKDLEPSLPTSDPRLLWDKQLEWANYSQDGHATQAMRRRDLPVEAVDRVVHGGEQRSV